MAVDVVDALELVDVEQHEARALAASRSREGGGRRLVKHSTSEETSQRVDRGLPLERRHQRVLTFSGARQEDRRRHQHRSHVPEVGDRFPERELRRDHHQLPHQRRTCHHGCTGPSQQRRAVESGEQEKIWAATEAS